MEQKLAVPKEEPKEITPPKSEPKESVAPKQLAHKLGLEDFDQGERDKINKIFQNLGLSKTSPKSMIHNTESIEKRLSDEIFGVQDPTVKQTTVQQESKP